MAIDPLLYEKVSGRSGDPYSRMGEALAGAEKGKSERKALKDVPLGSGIEWEMYKYKLLWGGGGAAVLIVILVVVLLLRLL